MNTIDCKSIRGDMLREAREKIASVPHKLKLAIVQVGKDDASEVYIRNKVKTCEKVGIDCQVVRCDYPITYLTLSVVIKTLVNDDSITGVILQLPLPDPLKQYERKLLDLIPYDKDVDGLSSDSVGRLWTGRPCITPATPTGILRLLPEDLSGKDVTIVNRSDLIGKPLTKLLLDRNATVTVCHSKTKFLLNRTRGADIVITGIGKAEYFDNWYMIHLQTWIDCGINRNGDGKLCGDIDLTDLKNMVIDVTPVPGGVGILTTAQLMLNVIKAYELQEGKI